MPRGGRRPGAGRKPGPKKPALVLRPDFGLPAAPPVAPADVDGLLTAPADLSPDDQKAWAALAPHALLERTLTPSRVAGFRSLCQRWVYCAQLDARIRELGIVSGEADRLLRRLEAWQKLLGASLGEFSLRSFGKPAVSDKPKAAVNPWAKVGP